MSATIEQGKIKKERTFTIEIRKFGEYGKKRQVFKVKAKNFKEGCRLAKKITPEGFKFSIFEAKEIVSCAEIAKF